MEHGFIHAKAASYRELQGDVCGSTIHILYDGFTSRCAVLVHSLVGEGSRANSCQNWLAPALSSDVFAGK